MMEENVLMLPIRPVSIETSSLGEDAGIVGTVSLVLQEMFEVKG